MIEIDAIARAALEALDDARSVAPLTARFGDFTLNEAYEVLAAVHARRGARGERAAGRKIGFTNRTIWAEYSVYAPIWGYLYDRTVKDIAALGGVFPLAGLAEPRIEPEIVFGLKAAPEPGMDEAALLSCVDWVAHGFEIVQSIFPGWRFTPQDAVAADGLHGALLLGPRAPAADGDWLAALPRFTIELKRGGATVERGNSADVLGGPLSALRHLVELLGRDAVHPPLAAGEIVTTGTLTRALAVAPGESWSTKLSGIALEPIAIRFA